MTEPGPVRRDDGYLLDPAPDRLDLDLLARFLAGPGYWARQVPQPVLRRAVAHSVAFGLYAPGGEQVGFARVITDHATFGYVCDVFVVDGHRGRGLAKWMVEQVLEAPGLRTLPRWFLATRDAQAVYGRFGFRPVHPEVFMAIDREPAPE